MVFNINVHDVVTFWLCVVCVALDTFVIEGNAIPMTMTTIGRNKTGRIMDTSRQKQTRTEEGRFPIKWLRKYESTVIRMSAISLMKGDRLYRINMQFSAFGNEYDLILRKHPETISQNFNIFIDERKLPDRETNRVLKSTGIYDGECKYCKCYVYGKIDSNWNFFEGEIRLPEDVIYIEKFSKYFNQSTRLARRPSSRLSIIYKRSDIIMNEYRKEFLGMSNDSWSNYTYIHKRDPTKSKHTQASRDRPRFTRSGSFDHTKASSGPTKQTCHMYLVADHLFFNVICQGNVEAVVAEMRYHISIADNTFRSTDFNGDGTGDNVGLSLANIKIYRQESDPNNKLANSQGAQYFLEKFAEYDWDDYCMAFAFTASDFGVTLGLAYVGSSNIHQVSGGICEKRSQFWSDLKNKLFESSYNVGMITFRNGMPRLQSSLTFTHEIGHAFGSQHDDDACSPGGDIGNFLMYPYVTSGNLPNNRVFSPCSRNMINPVIANRGVTCFQLSMESVCGNSIVEEGEECDCGNSETCHSIDPCCVPSDVAENYVNTPCTLKKSEGKLCSPRQSPCCTDACQYVEGSLHKLCSLKSQCRGQAFCPGDSAECGVGEQARNGTLCDSGRYVCHQGRCSVSVCVHNGLRDCQCEDDPAHHCSLCCKTIDGSCKSAASLGVVKGPDLKKSVGDPCLDNTGVCDADGVCIEFDPDDALEKLGDLFSMSTVKFARDWFKEYWYYILVGFLAFTLSSVMLVPKCRRRAMDTHTQAFKVGRLTKMISVARLIRTRDALTFLDVDKWIESRIDLIKHDKARIQRDLPQAVARLGVLFPTAPLVKLTQILKGCSTEDVAVRLLIIKGYPMQSIFAKCYKNEQ